MKRILSEFLYYIDMRIPVGRILFISLVSLTYHLCVYPLTITPSLFVSLSFSHSLDVSLEHAFSLSFFLSLSLSLSHIHGPQDGGRKRKQMV
jgi:hypothetical protein